MEQAQQPPETTWVNPITFVLQFLSSYGWILVGVGAAGLWAASRLRPALRRWQQEREDAEYHKDPDRVSARLAAVEAARARQQEMLAAASERALEVQREREERKRREVAERLAAAECQGGQRLGRAEYLPLSGAAGGAGYRAPKRSACSRGGCGR